MILDKNSTDYIHSEAFEIYVDSLDKKSKVNLAIEAVKKIKDHKFEKLERFHEIGIPFYCKGTRGALYYACKKHDFKTADWLLDHGADVNKGSPLSFSIVKKNIEAAKYLLDKNADPNQEIGNDIDHIKKNYETGYKRYISKKWKPIHFAASVGNIESINLLYNAHSDIIKEPVWNKGVNILPKKIALDFEEYEASTHLKKLMKNERRSPLEDLPRAGCCIVQ